MDFSDLMIYEAKTSDWFSPNIEYRGNGRAKFESPVGILTGDTHARFNEYGEDEIIMIVEEAIYPNGQKHSYFDFLGIGGLNQNKCVELIIETDNGILRAQDKIFWGPNFSWNESNGGELKITFHFMNGVFQAGADIAPKFWVLPLSNFQSYFFQKIPELSNHPLRLFPTPEIPSDIPETKREIAQYIANQKNRLIIFEFNHDYGFIEPLGDYEDRKSKLVTGKVRNILTAIMVGDISGLPSNNWEELEKWFPVDFLHLLGLATGSEVGSNTIEIRGENGELIRRIHIELGTPIYLKGHCALDETLHRGGIGTLLSNAILSEHWGKPYLRVILRQIIRGGYTEKSMLEERYIFLCLAVETLAKQLGYDAEYLQNSLNSGQKENVYAILHAAHMRILELTKNPRTKLNERRALERIANKIMDSVQKDKSFGWKVYKLLEHFHLLDAEVMEKHYKECPRVDGRKTWDVVLSYYRGSAIHEGYFTLDAKRAEAIEVLCMMSHLHDVLLRITFSMLNYDGNYDPTGSEYRTSRSINWVTLDTTIKELGYR